MTKKHDKELLRLKELENDIDYSHKMYINAKEEYWIAARAMERSEEEVRLAEKALQDFKSKYHG